MLGEQSSTAMLGTTVREAAVHECATEGAEGWRWGVGGPGLQAASASVRVEGTICATVRLVGVEPLQGAVAESRPQRLSRPGVAAFLAAAGLAGAALGRVQGAGAAGSGLAAVRAASGT